MKGHSERVPNKNLKMIAGQPLCLWMLQTLLQVPELSSIIVNTDSEEIANTCQVSDKIVIHPRPQKLCGDFVSMNDIIGYDISQSTADIYLQTHSTNPLLEADTISKALSIYIKNLPECDSLFSVTALQTRLYDKNQQPINHDPNTLMRTQDLDPIYEENSNLYIFSGGSFHANNQRIGKNPYMYSIPAKEAIDIDELIDFEIADFLLRKKHNKES